MKKYGPADIQVLSLVQGICKRPAMYTPNGTVEEVMLVLFGIFLATREPCFVGTDVNILMEKYDGPLNSRLSIFNIDKILSNIKAEGYESDREILDRIIEVLE
jgi:hypothetical protein